LIAGEVAAADCSLDAKATAEAGIRNGVEVLEAGNVYAAGGSVEGVGRRRLIGLRAIDAGD